MHFHRNLIRVVIISLFFGFIVTYLAGLIIESWLRLMNAPI